jgi:hypothetical protein
MSAAIVRATSTAMCQFFRISTGRITMPARINALAARALFSMNARLAT